MLKNLRIVTWKKLTNKTPTLKKSMNMDIWVVGTSNQLFVSGFFTETKSSRKGSYWQRSGFFWWVHFVLPIQFIGFWQGSFFQNVVFSILVFSTKKRYSSFEKGFHFSVQVSKMFKIFSDCHIKTCRSLKRRAFLKIPSTDF